MNQVTDLIADLPADERIMVSRLRTLILETDPRLQEKLSYGVPYFYHNRRICFLWPASLVPPCNKPKHQVTLGLCYGTLLSDEQGLLDKGNRKQVCTIGFSSLKEISDQVIREIILEAVLVDDQFKKKKR